MGVKFCVVRKSAVWLIASIFLLTLDNVHPTSSSKALPMPTIMKIFDNPQPNDGYESLRTFGGDMSEGLFRGKQLYNTSIALTSGLFSFQLPSSTSTEAQTIKLANQVIFGMFGFLFSMLIFALPVLITGQRFNPNARSNNDGDNDEGIIASLLKTEPLARLIKEGVHKQIGLEPEKCLQKTICEAHRAPKNKEYGMMALPFQMFYPPSSKDKKSGAPSSPFQKAAYVGKYTKTRCDQKYNCFFDVLDLGRYLVDWYQYHHPGRVNANQSV